MTGPPNPGKDHEAASRIDEISPSDAVSIESIPGAGRLRTEDTGAIRADWMVFDPEKLIQLLEEYHEDEAVMIATTSRELQAGPEAGLIYIGDVSSGDETLSVLGEMVTGKDSKRLVKWRSETRAVSADGAGGRERESGTEGIPEHGDRVELSESYGGMSDAIAEYVGLEGLVVAGHGHVMNTTDDRTLVHFDENPTDRAGGPRYWVRTDCLTVVNAGEGFDQ